jgi:choline dehydrogenase
MKLNTFGNRYSDVNISPERMREIFVKTEKNLYLPRGTPGHGFDGYLQLNEGNGTVFTTSPQSSEIYRSLVSEVGQNPDELEQLFDTDPNQLRSDRDQTVGLFGGVFHANRTWGRYSVRDHVLTTLRAVDATGRKRYPLEVRLNSLASKVLFEDSVNGNAPRAIGVEYLEGKSIYQGDLRYNASNDAITKQVYANKEVIVSGGTFNTPQLLLLSGVGPAADLEALNITVVADLPGVGRNMQDHNEIATIGLAAQNISVDGGSGFPRSQCTPRAPNDPCYDLWQQGHGPYAEGSIMGSMFFLKTNHSSTGERDIGMWSGPVGVRGFWPQTPNQSFIDPPNTFGFHTVHMHGSNRAGYVKLRSADPTAQPEINFRHFSDEGADQDIAAIKEAVAFFRRVHAGVVAPVGPNEVIWPTCSGSVSADGSCSDEANDEQFIRDNNYGHHATSTSSIGSDDDPNAVLDSKFRVRGVEGLRVVDASAFPRAPGAFPVLAVFMLSEKAALDILSTQ